MDFNITYDPVTFTNNRLFSVWDYLVFSLVLVVSASIGIYYGCTGGKQKTTSEFLMANRSMSFIPVAMSLLASFMSAITLLGTPAEIYRFGTIYWYIWVGYVFVIPIAAHVFLPIFYNLHLTSVYEYLELRFKSLAVRRAAAITFIIQMVLYMSIVLYAPCLALEQVTGFRVVITVFVVGLVCTFYTTLGGMKAVMWTDTFQIIMMFAGLMAVLIQGSIDLGGFGKIWQDNYEGGRIDFSDFNPDPFKRHTFWTLTIGGCFTWLAIYGVNQAQVQRALCVSSLKDGQRALWFNLPGLTALLTICSLCGMVIYSQYKRCDPLSTENPTFKISASDQLLPFYAVARLNHIPGLPGLLVASLFSGGLSTISSGLNSLSAVCLQDILKTTPCFKNMTEERATLISKIIAATFGLITIGLTFVAALLGSVLQAALALFGMIGGPLLGLFALGVLYPCANKIGALVGLFSGLIMTFWVGIGGQIYKPYNPMLPMTTIGCPLVNGTDFDPTKFYPKNITVPPVKEGVYYWYELSYLHYGTLAVIWVTFVGVVVSCLTGPMKRKDIDPKLLFSIGDIMCCCCPRSVRKFFNCCQPSVDDDEDIDTEKYTGNEFKTAENGIYNPAFEQNKPPEYSTRL